MVWLRTTITGGVELHAVDLVFQQTVSKALPVYGVATVGRANATGVLEWWSSASAILGLVSGLQQDINVAVQKVPRPFLPTKSYSIALANEKFNLSFNRQQDLRLARVVGSWDGKKFRPSQGVFMKEVQWSREATKALVTRQAQWVDEMARARAPTHRPVVVFPLLKGVVFHVRANDQGSGYGVVAFALWCALVRKIRSSSSSFAEWSRRCGASLAPGLGNEVRAWEKPPSSWLAAVQSLWTEHVSYIDRMQMRSTRPSKAYFEEQPFPPLPLDPGGPTGDTPFQDMYRFWLKTQAEDSTVDWTRWQPLVWSLAVGIMTDTLCHPHVAILCNESYPASLPCRLGWRRSGPYQPAITLPLYTFLGYEDVEETRTKKTTRFPFENRVGQGTWRKDDEGHIKKEFTRFEGPFRTLEFNMRSPHALWSFTFGDYQSTATSLGKSVQYQTLVLGGLGNFANHRCHEESNVLRLNIPQNVQEPCRITTRKQTMVSIKQGDELTMYYGPNPLELMGGKCYCGTHGCQTRHLVTLS